MGKRATSASAVAHVKNWETMERLLDSGGYESRQRVLVGEAVVETSESGARWLGVAYWHTVERFTRGAVRASWSAAGGTLRLLGASRLLTFGPPELEARADVVSCRHTIRGGLLAMRAGGSVTLAQQRVEDGYELSVTVEEYVPRLAGSLYAKGQSPFHAAVSRRYFELLVARRAS